MQKKSIAPSVSEIAFDCPHCGVYTTHTWYDVYAQPRSGEPRAPGKLPPDVMERVQSDPDPSDEQKLRFVAYYEKILSGLVPLEERESGTNVHIDVGNLYLSECFACGKVSVWIQERVLFPPLTEGPAPNADLPDDVHDDYVEAGRIVSLSPRGAAALLRLAIQKLCMTLGGTGKNLDDDIAQLVKQGLSPMVQRSLDAVRVVGNEAVHPGTLDLKDDTDAASSLFTLVNIIAELMISNPRHVEELYGKLPEAKRKATEARDGES